MRHEDGLSTYALELLTKPGCFVCYPLSLGAATIMTFPTTDAAEAYRWSQDALLVMGTRVTATLLRGM